MTVSTSPQIDRTAHVAKQAHGSNRADASGTGARIIEVAARLFRQIGHKKTTVADIAREMSMSSANVYRFFRSRRAIEETVVGELLEHVVLAASSAACCDGSAIERLRAVLQTVGEQHRIITEDGKLHELVASAVCDRWSVASAYADRMDRIVAKVISDGQASDELPRGDAMTVAKCVLNATGAYHASPCANAGRPTLSQMINFCTGALRAAQTWRMLQADEDTKQPA